MRRVTIQRLHLRVAGVDPAAARQLVLSTAESAARAVAGAESSRASLRVRVPAGQQVALPARIAEELTRALRRR